MRPHRSVASATRGAVPLSCPLPLSSLRAARRTQGLHPVMLPRALPQTRQRVGPVRISSEGRAEFQPSHINAKPVQDVECVEGELVVVTPLEIRVQDVIQADRWLW